MEQNIVCKNGKCVDKNTMSNKFSELFDNNNIVNQIQGDLMTDMLYKKRYA